MLNDLTCVFRMFLFFRNQPWKYTHWVSARLKCTEQVLCRKNTKYLSSFNQHMNRQQTPFGMPNAHIIQPHHSYCTSIPILCLHCISIQFSVTNQRQFNFKQFPEIVYHYPSSLFNLVPIQQLWNLPFLEKQNFIPEKQKRHANIFAHTWA